MKTILEIKEKLSSGDIAVASKMIGITATNGSKALYREGSKHHEKMLAAIEKVIKMREQLMLEGADC